MTAWSPSSCFSRVTLRWLFYAGLFIAGSCSEVSPVLGAESSNLKPAINPALTVEAFPPIEARFLRFTALKTNGRATSIDEIEVFTAGENSKNVALATAGAVFSESGSKGDAEPHGPERLGDGLFGHENSWIAASEGVEWVQIEFSKAERIDRVHWGRDRTGDRWERTAVEYHIEVSMDATNWIRVGSSEQRLPGLRLDAIELNPFEETVPNASAGDLNPPINSYLNVDEFPPISAKFIRFRVLQSPTATASLDELEVFSSKDDGINLALASNGGVASTSNSEPYKADDYTPGRLNDGLYGNEGMWICDTNSPVWAQIELPRLSEVHRVVWSRDRTGERFDRMPLRYRIEVAAKRDEWIEVSSSDKRRKSAWLHYSRSEHTPEEYLVDSWGEEDGLPLNSINDIAQTPDGYLWLGTDNGLLRFDGQEFVPFNRSNTPAISTPKISSVYADRQGRLWFTNRKFFYESRNNLVLYERGSFRRIELEGDYLVSYFLEDEEGPVWMITEGGALPWRSGELDYEGMVHRSNLASNVEWQEWKGQPGKWHHGKFVPLFGYLGRPGFLSKSGLGSKQLARRDGGAWILEGGITGRENRGANRFRRAFADGRVSPANPFPWTDETFKETASLSDRSNQLWVAAEGRGLFCLFANGQGYRSFAGLRDFGIPAIQKLYEDSGGDIWVASSDAGLKRLRKRLFKVIDSEHGITSLYRSISVDNTYSVSPAAEGGVWIGTHSSSAYRWDDRRLSFLLNSFIFTWALLEDSQGIVWTGAYGRGIRRHFRDQVQVLPDVLDHPFAFLEDRKQRVWVGGDFGLNLVDGNTMHRRVPPSFSKGRFEWVASLLEDTDGAMWLGTKLGYLHRYQDDVFETHWVAEEGEEYPVCALYLDRFGALWAARFGFGLTRFHEGKVTHYRSVDGLPAVSMNGILDDPNGYLWMTSKQGVYRISHEDFDRFSQGNTSPFLWQRFTEKDGLPSNDCQGEQNQPSLSQTDDGRIWIPTLEGVGILDPAAIEREASVPPVLIRDVTLYSEGHQVRTLISDGEYSPDQEPPSITIPPGNHNLMIRYTAVDFVAPKQVSFRYRLFGSEEGWIDAKNERAALIASLRSGAYRFELMAVNHLGQSGPPASLLLVVQPFWWETAVFRFLMTGAIILVGLAWYSTRMKELRRKHELQADFSRQLIEREEAERMRIAQELHDGLGHELLLVRNRALDGANKADSSGLQGRFEDISDLAGQALENTRGMAYNLRPFELDRIGFKKAVETMVTKVSESSKTRYFKDIDELDGALSGKKLVYLYRLVQEGLNNILKHSQASVVMIEVKREGQRVRVQLEDNGNGFDPESTRGGLGLNGMRERARLINGDFHLRSAPGEGTQIRILIPF